MKTGYSLLLGEYVEAEALEYHDCEHWQIVCPACKEPLFKCRRETPFVTHYLSHYGKDRAYVEECELRVSALGVEEIRRTATLSREQRLAYFMKVFENALFKRGSRADVNTLKKTYSRMNKSVAFNTMFDAVRNLVKNTPRSFVEENVDRIIEFHEKGSGIKLTTSLDISVQKRIACDFLLHLRSSKGSTNMRLLFNHEAFTYYHELHKRFEEDKLTGVDMTIYVIMRELTNTSVQKSKGLSEFMMTNAVPDGRSIFVAVTELILESMIFTLCRLDYYELIVGSNDKKSLV